MTVVWVPVMKLCVGIQHQHIMSGQGFKKCAYSNIIGNAVVSRTCCEPLLLGAANLLCEATWSFQKWHFVYKWTSYVLQPMLKGHFNCVARVAWSGSAECRSKRCNWYRFTLSSKVSTILTQICHFSILDQSHYSGMILLYYGYTWHLNIRICYYIIWDISNIIEVCFAYYKVLYQAYYSVGIWYCNIRKRCHVNIKCHFNVTLWHYILYVDINIYNPHGFTIA